MDDLVAKNPCDASTQNTEFEIKGKTLPKTTGFIFDICLGEVKKLYPQKLTKHKNKIKHPI